MAFLFRLETREGAPAEPPTLTTAVPNWRAGDTIPLGNRTLRVVAVRDEDADEPPATSSEPSVRTRSEPRWQPERASRSSDLPKTCPHTT